MRNASELGVRQPRELLLNQPNNTPLLPASLATASFPDADNLSFSVREGIAFANQAGVTER